WNVELLLCKSVPIAKLLDKPNSVVQLVFLQVKFMRQICHELASGAGPSFRSYILAHETQTLLCQLNLLSYEVPIHQNRLRLPRQDSSDRILQLFNRLPDYFLKLSKVCRPSVHPASVGVILSPFFGELVVGLEAKSQQVRLVLIVVDTGIYFLGINLKPTTDIIEMHSFDGSKHLCPKASLAADDLTGV